MFSYEEEEKRKKRSSKSPKREKVAVGGPVPAHHVMEWFLCHIRRCTVSSYSASLVHGLTQIGRCTAVGIPSAGSLVNHSLSETPLAAGGSTAYPPLVMRTVLRQPYLGGNTQHSRLWHAARLLALSFRLRAFAHRSLAHLRLRPSPDTHNTVIKRQPLAVASIPPLLRRRAASEPEQTPLHPTCTIVLSPPSIRLRRPPASTRRTARHCAVNAIFLAALWIAHDLPPNPIDVLPADIRVRLFQAFSV